MVHARGNSSFSSSADARLCMIPPPPFPPSSCSLPPPIMLPPIFPPLLNAWMNPTVTYTRVTVEDLLRTNSVNAHLSNCSLRTQLNPLACPFKPAFRRSLDLLINDPSQSYPNNHCLEKTDQCHLVKPASAQIGLCASSRFPPRPFIRDASRGPVYSGRIISATNQNQNQHERAAFSLPFDSEEKSSEFGTGYKRDIAKMIWEAADLYDNALKVIRQRREEWRRNRKIKKPKSSKTLSSSSSSPRTLTRRSTEMSDLDDCIVDATLPQECNADANTTVLGNYDGEVRGCKFFIGECELGRKNCDDNTGGDIDIEKRNWAINIDSSVERETGEKKNAGLALSLEGGAIKKNNYSFVITQEAIVNAIAHLKQYTVDDLKLGAVKISDFKLHPSSSLSSSLLNRLGGQCGGIRMLHLGSTVENNPSREQSREICSRSKQADLVNKGEVPRDAIIKAVATMIRKIRRKKRLHKTSKRKLHSFIKQRRDEIIKELKLSSFRLSIRDKHIGRYCKLRKIIRCKIFTKNVTVRKARPYFMIKIRRRPRTKTRFKNTDEDCSTAICVSDDNVSERPLPVTNPPAEQVEPTNSASLCKTAPTLSEKIDATIANCKSMVEAIERQIHKASKHPSTPKSYRTASKLRFIRSSPKKLRQAIIRIISPDKEDSSRNDEEKTGTDNCTMDELSHNVPTLADFLSYRGRQAAAPTSIVIRTVEKKTKKRNKRGWRKSWI